MRAGHNVGFEKGVARLFPEARAGMDKVDVLINCVGMAGPHAALKEITNEDCQTTLQVNVTGIFERIEPEIKVIAWFDPAVSRLEPTRL